MTIQEYNNCVNAYSDDVYRFVLKNIPVKEDARDMVQMSFETLWLNRNEVDMEKAKSYLFTVAYRKVVDYMRKNKRTSLTEILPERKQENTNHEYDLKKLLHKALEELSPQLKQLVLLKDYEGCSYEEMSGITGLNVSQVKVYLHRARLQLKQKLISVETHI